MEAATAATAPTSRAGGVADPLPHSYSGNENTVLTETAAQGLLVGATGLSLSAGLSSGPSNGSVTINPDGSFTYTPNTGFCGNDGFTYTVSDAQGSGTSAPVTASITVAGGASVPAEALGGSYSGDENSAIALGGLLSVSASPNQGDPLSTVLSVSHGTVTVAAGAGATVVGNGTSSVTLSGTAAAINASTESYAGNLDYYGADMLTVTTTDTADGQATATKG